MGKRTGTNNAGKEAARRERVSEKKKKRVRESALQENGSG
jgi:hypothetical protein